MCVGLLSVSVVAFELWFHCCPFFCLLFSIWRLCNFLDWDWEHRDYNLPESLLDKTKSASDASWIGQMLFASPPSLSEFFILRVVLDLWLPLKSRIAFGGCGNHFPAWLRHTDTHSVQQEWESPRSSGCTEYLSLEVLFIKTSLRWTLR